MIIRVFIFHKLLLKELKNSKISVQELRSSPKKIHVETIFNITKNMLHQIILIQNLKDYFMNKVSNIEKLQEFSNQIKTQNMFAYLMLFDNYKFNHKEGIFFPHNFSSTKPVYKLDFSRKAVFRGYVTNKDFIEMKYCPTLQLTPQQWSKNLNLSLLEEFFKHNYSTNLNNKTIHYP